MLANPGNYKVEAAVHGYTYKVYFTIISNPVGVAENKNTNAYIQVFPNPTHDFINVTSEQESIKTISLKNYFGQEVKSFDVNSYHLEIPIGDLPSGIYFVQVATLNDKISIRKLVVE